MADHSFGEIQIGGKVPRSILPAFIAHLKKEGLLDADATEEALVPNHHGVLDFVNENAIGGAFYDLEQFLVEHKIDFDRQTSPSNYYDAENVSWRKGEVRIDSRDAMTRRRSSPLTTTRT